MLKSSTIIMGVFIAAFFFWMLVETPFANLTRQIFTKPATPAVDEKKESIKETKIAEDENGIDMTQTQVEDGTIVMKMRAL